MTRQPKLLSSYTEQMQWPRSVCCLSSTDGSLIVCQQEQCCLLLFTSQLMLRSTCGGQRGTGPYEFDSPWCVASLFDVTSSNILVADTNNRRVQYFTIANDGQFIHKRSLSTKHKPYFLSTSHEHFAVSCEHGFVLCYSARDRKLVKRIDLTTISSVGQGYIIEIHSIVVRTLDI
jgi:hypothetical protein